MTNTYKQSLKGVLLLPSKFVCCCFYKFGIEDGSENDKATVRNINCTCLPGV